MVVTQDPNILEAFVRNSEALTNLNATVAAIQQEMTQLRQTIRDSQLTSAAKIENLDRSLGELRLVVEQTSVAKQNTEGVRQKELERIYALLTDERTERREIAGSQGKDERELIREIIRAELGDRRQERHLAARALSEAWKVGGKYIVAAICLLIVVAILKLTGVSVADLVGMTNK